MQNYNHLGKFLKKEMCQCSDPVAAESMASQFAYLSHLHNNQLSIAELTKRIENLEKLKADYAASIVDNRPTYRAKTAQAVSKLTALQVAA
ncbi:hypothetical protein [Arsukibacterium sp.]|uniref:hypothetical protein n=1 Tax=Arsukibacterium sp. TaxID=1977258 RepID=UPI002FD9AC0B